MQTYATKSGTHDKPSGTRKTASKPQGPTRQQDSDSALEHQVNVIQQMADKSRQLKANSQQLTANSQKPTANSQKPTAKNRTGPSDGASRTGLPNTLKAGVESLSGYSMDDVKVHYNSSKPAQLHAHAYAQGTDIHLGPGQEKHLPHESWHVVQQKQGRVNATTQLKGVGINTDTGLEREADVMGAKAIQSPGAAPARQLRRMPQTNSKSPVVQGKFGFELELQIALESKIDDGRFDVAQDYIKDKDEDVLGIGKGFTVHLDHQKLKKIGDTDKEDNKYELGNTTIVDDLGDDEEYVPIIELVTAPIDEATETEEQVRKRAKTLKETAEALGKQIGKRTLLNGIAGIKANKNIVVGGGGKGKQSTDTYIHATYGVAIENVTRAFAGHARAATHKFKNVKGNEEWKERSKEYLKAAVTIANTMIEYVTDDSDFKKKDLKMMRGVFALVANYMLNSSVKSDKYLLKNRLGVFFYKSSLNKVVAELHQTQQDYLKDNAETLSKELIKKCKEKRKIKENNVVWDKKYDEQPKNIFEQKVFKDKYMGADEKSDFFLLEKNPESKVLGPEDVGKEKKRGIVMENRHIDKTLLSRKRRNNKFQPKDYENIFLNVYHAVQAMNASMSNDLAVGNKLLYGKGKKKKL